MVKRSKRIYPDAEMGDSVTILIPAVDREISDPNAEEAFNSCVAF